MRTVLLNGLAGEVEHACAHVSCTDREIEAAPSLLLGHRNTMLRSLTTGAKNFWAQFRRMPWATRTEYLGGRGSEVQCAFGEILGDFLGPTLRRPAG